MKQQQYHIGDTNKMITAVEYIIEQVKSKEWQDMFIWHKEEVFKQAKEMEDKQLNEAFQKGGNDAQSNYYHH
jgi:hypothetical protein